MTLDALIKKLQKIRETSGPRAYVCVDLAEFRMVSDNCSHWKIHDVEAETIPYRGHDGEIFNSNGDERYRHVVSIK